jgi:hypothetical protein
VRNPFPGRFVCFLELSNYEGGFSMSTYPEDGFDAPVGRERLGATAAMPAAPQQYQQPYQPYGPHYGYGPGGGTWAMRPRRVYPVETKPFFLTSEFAVSVLAVAGIAITAAASDAFGAWRAWILITAVTVGYLVSRGIAKSGTRSHAADPREHLDLDWGRRESGDDRS